MSDQRPVSTDALQTLGTIIKAGGRDAIHLAVEPIEAAERLLPGQHVGIVDGKASKKAVKKLGIVDPFIEDIVMPGEKFWLVVYPRQITSLRHVWTHPDFDNPPIGFTPIEIARLWIEGYAGEHGRSYEEVMDYADVAVRDSGHSYIIGGSEMEGAHVSQEFWDNYEIVRGIKVEPDNRRNFFTCSC